MFHTLSNLINPISSSPPVTPAISTHADNIAIPFLIPQHTSTPISPTRLLLTMSSVSNNPVPRTNCNVSMTHDSNTGISTSDPLGLSLYNIAPNGTNSQILLRICSRITGLMKNSL